MGSEQQGIVDNLSLEFFFFLINLFSGMQSLVPISMILDIQKPCFILQ